jgi:DNA-binding MarR family transcriptional regulator
LKIDATNKKIRNALQLRFDSAAIDLTVDQWLVLNHAFQNEGISQIELCDLVYKDAATLTRIIDLLVRKDFMVREMAIKDRRRFNIFLTDNGRITYHRAFPIMLDIRRQGWDLLSDEEYKTFTHILDVIFNNF